MFMIKFNKNECAFRRWVKGRLTDSCLKVIFFILAGLNVSHFKNTNNYEVLLSINFNFIQKEINYIASTNPDLLQNRKVTKLN